MASRHEFAVQLYRTDFRAFVDFAFNQLHVGQTLIPHWYIDLIADRIDGVIEGGIKRLVINAPPRTLKTLIATLAHAAFVLGRDPRKRILIITGHAALASDLMMRLRRLVGSDRYRSIFPNMRLKMAGTTIQTQQGGGIRCTIVGQQISGHGADLVIVDDPLSPSHAADDHVREQVNKWFDAEVMQRLNSRQTGALVLVMQRVDAGDLAGHLRHGKEKFDFVVLPSVATSHEDWLLADGRRLSRKQGEVLDRNGSSVEEQLSLYRQVGSYVYATQYLQHTCGSANGQLRMLWEPKGPDWSPQNWSLRGGFRLITLDDRILHRAFGRPLPEHANWRTTPPLNDDEWQAAALEYGRRCAEYERDPTLPSPYGRQKPLT